MLGLVSEYVCQMIAMALDGMVLNEISFVASSTTAGGRTASESTLPSQSSHASVQCLCKKIIVEYANTLHYILILNNFGGHCTTI